MITLAILAVLALVAGIIAFLVCDDLVRLLVQSESEQLNIEASSSCATNWSPA